MRVSGWLAEAGLPLSTEVSCRERQQQPEHAPAAAWLAGLHRKQCAFSALFCVQGIRYCSRGLQSHYVTLPASPSLQHDEEGCHYASSGFGCSTGALVSLKNFRRDVDGGFCTCCYNNSSTVQFRVVMLVSICEHMINTCDCHMYATCCCSISPSKLPLRCCLPFPLQCCCCWMQL